MYDGICKSILFPVIIKVVTDLCGWDVDTKTAKTPLLGI